jgi:hypothetical protein
MDMKAMLAAGSKPFDIRRDFYGRFILRDSHQSLAGAP